MVYVFHGSCDVGPVADAGATFRLATYKGYTATFALAKNDAGPGSTVSVADAAGKGDITGTYRGKTFPPYPSPCNSATCPGTAFLYLLIDLKSPKPVHLSGTSSIVVTSARGFPGTKACLFASLNTLGPHSRLGWSPLIRAGGPKGKTLTIDIDQPNFAPGYALVAIACV
jgi:hypothetical protein